MIESSSGRLWDPQVALHQIGSLTVAGISGGRWSVNAVGDLVLPVAAGYSVEVAYAADDTYTVRRVFSRGIKRWVKGEAASVYADQLSEVAWYASCYHDEWIGA